MGTNMKKKTFSSLEIFFNGLKFPKVWIVFFKFAQPVSTKYPRLL